jgi:outer membrane protein assembly factor BamB
MKNLSVLALSAVLFLLTAAPALHAKAGKTLWTIQTGDDVYSSPCVWDNKVYFGSDDHKLHCVDTGSKEKGAAYSN